MMIPDSQFEGRGKLMKSRSNNSDGISEVVSVILVIALLLALTIVVYALISGQLDPKYMQKSVYIAGSSAIIPLNSNLDYILTYLPKAGDDFYLVGQKQGRGTPVTIKVLSPDGRNPTPDTSGLTGSLYGKTLYIYQKSSSNACEYVVSDAAPKIAPPPMVNGIWKIQIIDEKIHILADTYTMTFTKGTTSLPVTVLLGTGIGGKSYRADCSVTNGTCGGGCPPQYNTSPCNKSYSTFGGSNYLSFPDDPTLKYTGDLSISVSFKPTSTGDYSNPSNWHQIIGKGIIYPNNTEVDNYQIFQVGDKLLFEWNDKTTGIHYQAITTTSPAPVVANNWNDVTVSITNGIVKIYRNGELQDLVYNRGGDPRSITTPSPNPPVVNLLNNGNNVTIGKQNGPGASSYFYFNGDIGGISLYNRGLSPEEIRRNLCPT
jgi:hypothetical protein